jgi:hypothetical protein
MNREPIFWTTTQPGYNDRDRQRTITVEENGKKVRRTEKFPQRGHVGDYDDRRTAPGERWMLVVRHDGNEVRAPLTNGAAHMDSATAYGKYMRVKARFLGWFDPRQCPCALRVTNELLPETLVSEEALTGQPCQPDPDHKERRCAHSIAEKAARTAKHNVVQSQREIDFKSKEDKILDAMRDQTAALMSNRASSGGDDLAKELGFSSVAALREFLAQKPESETKKGK